MFFGLCFGFGLLFGVCWVVVVEVNGVFSMLLVVDWALAFLQVTSTNVAACLGVVGVLVAAN